MGIHTADDRSLARGDPDIHGRGRAHGPDCQPTALVVRTRPPAPVSRPSIPRRRRVPREAENSVPGLRPGTRRCDAISLKVGMRIDTVSRSSMRVLLCQKAPHPYLSAAFRAPHSSPGRRIYRRGRRRPERAGGPSSRNERSYRSRGRRRRRAHHHGDRRGRRLSAQSRTSFLAASQERQPPGHSACPSRSWACTCCSGCTATGSMHPPACGWAGRAHAAGRGPWRRRRTPRRGPSRSSPVP